jgi:regulatory protein
MRQNLLKRGCDASIVDVTLLRLQNAGLVDDVSFAKAWVENRNTFRPRSGSVLRMELRRKGLDDEVIQSTLTDAVDEEKLAYEAARKQARRYASLEWPDFRKKLGGFLARRGFSYHILAPVVSEVWKEVKTADPGSTFENKE